MFVFFKSYLSDVLTHIFNDHFISSNSLHGEKAPLVNPTASKAKFLLAELEDCKIKKSFR